MKKLILIVSLFQLVYSQGVRSINAQQQSTQRITTAYDDTASYFRWGASNGVHTLYIPYNLSPTVDTGGITSLNGLVTSAQSFAIDTSYATSPVFVSSGSTHTLRFPMDRINNKIDTTIGMTKGTTQVVTAPKYWTARQYMTSLAVDTASGKTRFLYIDSMLVPRHGMTVYRSNSTFDTSYAPITSITHNAPPLKKSSAFYHDYYNFIGVSEDAMLGLVSKNEGGHSGGIDIVEVDSVTGNMNDKWTFMRNTQLQGSTFRLFYGTGRDGATNKIIMQWDSVGNVFARADYEQSYGQAYRARNESGDVKTLIGTNNRRVNINSSSGGFIAIDMYAKGVLGATLDSTLLFTHAGNVSMAGDLAITATTPDITTTSTGTGSLFNTNLTTLNIGGATTALNLGSNSVAGEIALRSSLNRSASVQRGSSTLTASIGFGFQGLDLASSTVTYAQLNGIIHKNTASIATGGFTLTTRTAGVMTNQWLVDSAATTFGTTSRTGARDIYFKDAYSNSKISADSSFTINERITTPTAPTSNTQMHYYMKGDKIVWQINDAGTVRYYYFDATATSNQSIIYSATAP